MIISDELNLSKNSHKKVVVKCDFKISDNCRSEWISEYRAAKLTCDNNDGKSICLQCSRAIKASGRNNPNCKYTSIDDNMFEVIDTPEKAFCLGWFASDGTLNNNTIKLSIHQKDVKHLIFVRDLICGELPIVYFEEEGCSPMVKFVISSQKMMNDCCRHLKILPGKKDYYIRLPDLTDELKWYFLCGYFNGDGCVNKIGKSKRHPVASIASNSLMMLEDIKEFTKIPSYICNTKSQSIEFDGNNALDFLGKIFTKQEFALERKYKRFLEWCQWIPSLQEPGKGDNIVRWTRTRKDAVRPSKNNISDSGYDLTILEPVKTVGMVTFYSTGIKINPSYGYYFQLVPRSSISKTGHMLANSVGIIDRAFVGEILVPIIKIDKDAPDLVLPMKIAQLIPCPIQHFQLQEVNELQETSRGEKGFGSSGR